MSHDEEATAAKIPATVARLRENHDKARPLPLEWRKKQLLQLIALIQENRKEILDAIQKDLRILPEMNNLTELGSAIQEANLAISKLKEWTKPSPRSIPLTAAPGKAFVQSEAYGVVSIIAPWNYPFRLLAFPLIGAIAAGNAVLLKPSEVSSNTSKVLKRLFDRYLDPNFIATVEGGVQVSSAILAQRFDYIFYTGNTEVGKIVMKAAAEHLTPVTLELGGKSPVIIDKSAKLDVAVKRILGAKFGNSGQTCVAPDYILIDKEIKDKFIDLAKARIREWYGENPQESSSYSRVINERHTSRIKSLLDEVKEKVIIGGRVDVADHYVEPTLIDEPSPDSKLMQDEIFGPVLPILAINNVQEAIKFVVQRPKPLALYIFSENEKLTQEILDRTSSGGVCVNGAILHIICPDMEFGGVGPSGMGAYNGKHTFDTFSHKRAVLKKATWVDPGLLYPPYSESTLKTLNSIADGVKIPKGLTIGAVVVLILACVVALALGLKWA